MSLKKLDYLTRKQIQKLHDLKGDRNARRVLQQMNPYLSHFYDGQKIYYLSKEGREKVNCKIARSKITTAQHYLMRNDLYIHLGQPATWRNEIKMISHEGKKDEIVIVADAHFTRNGRHHIIEIDNMQKMKKNKIKIDKYRRLIQRNSFKEMPKLIWVTTTEYRRKALLDLSEGLDVDVYLPDDFN
ncbi:replication-relaxation family protein [Bacillaceae bacterium W0354]